MCTIYFSVHMSIIPYSQGSAVQCTCMGFQVPSLVKLWQSFRTYSMSAAVSALPKITCSICHHTLQTHQPMEMSLSPNKIGTEGGSDILTGKSFESVQNPQLTLKASVKLAFTPFNGCVQVLPAESKSGGVTLVCLTSATEGELRVVICTVQLASNIHKQTHTLLEESTGKNIVSQVVVSNDSKESSSSSDLKELQTHTNTGSSDGDLPAKKVSRKRKRNTQVNILLRRSARVRKQSKKNKVDVEQDKRTARLLEEEKERQRREMERVRMEQQALCGCLVDFVSSVEKRDSFTSYSLPEVHVH